MRNPLTQSLSANNRSGEPAWYAGLPEAHRYTERLKRALALAVEEARRFRHGYLGTEHLLLGILAEGQGVGAKALIGFGIELSRFRERLLMVVQPGHGPAARDANLTPRARQSLRFAVHEARGLGHTYVGQEHLLLALTRPGDEPDEPEENTGEIMSLTLLRAAGVDVEALRQAVTAAMTRGIKTARDNVIACRVDDRTLDSIDALIETGIHATRSEAAARLILDGLEANRPLLERVQAAVADIRRLREQTQQLAQQWRAERTASLSTPDRAAGSSEAEQGAAEAESAAVEKGTVAREIPVALKRPRRQSR